MKIRKSKVNGLITLVVSLPLIFGGCFSSKPKEPKVEFFRDGYTIQIGKNEFNYNSGVNDSRLITSSDDGRRIFYDDTSNNGRVNEVSIPTNDHTYMYGTRFINRSCANEDYKEQCDSAQKEFEGFTKTYDIEKTHEKWLTWLRENYPRESGELAERIHDQHYGSFVRSGAF